MKEKILALYDKINNYDQIIIHRHKRPDLDAFGSQMALKEFLKINFLDKEIYAVGEDGHEEFDYIGMVDVIRDELYRDSLVIIVDTANYDRIEDDRFKMANEVIKIDHHIDLSEEQYGVINLVDPSMSSTCEYLFNIFEELNKFDKNLVLDKWVANYLFYGIYGDTGGFKYPNTTTNTFRAISEIVKFPFDYEKTIMQLNVYDYEIMKIVGIAYNMMTIEEGVGVIVFDKKFQQEHNIKPNKLSIIVNFLGNIRELKAWLVFNEYNHFIRVNMRSRKEFNMEQIAIQFNGGGHKNASGASIKRFEEMEDVIKKVKNEVNKG